MNNSHIAYLGLRSVFALLGFQFFYMAIFMFRDEHGRLQNRLVDLWIAIKQAEDSTGELFRRSAALAETGTAWLLGPKTLSFKAGLISCYLSLASMQIAAATSDPFRSRRLDEAAWAAGLVIFTTVVVRRVAMRWAVIALSLVCVTMPIWMGLQELWPQYQERFRPLPDAALVIEVANIAIGFIVIFPGMIVDFLAIGINRIFIKRSSHPANRTLIVLVLLYNAAWAVVIFLAFALRLDLIFHGWTKMLGSHNIFVAFVIMSPIIGGFFTAIGCSTFFLVVCIALIHRGFWPMLDRILTAMAEFNVLSNRKVQVSLGAICLIFAFGGLPSLLEVLKILK